MKINVLVDWVKRVIDITAFKKWVHTHLSGREFTQEELKNFWFVEKKIISKKK